MDIVKRAFLAMLVASLTFGTATFVSLSAGTTNSVPDPASPAQAVRGQQLFDHNCAHCHGDDARGDEGPDLHGLTKSNERLQKIIKNGIKGEMPAFGKKFSDADVEALIVFLHTLRE